MKSSLSVRTVLKPAIESRDRPIVLGPKSTHILTESEIDATLADSFPASDPPSWTLGVSGNVSM